MKTATLRISVVLTTLLINAAFFTRATFGEEPARRPAESGTFGMLLEHASDLKLTDEQKKQLEEIKADYTSRSASLANDPKMKDLYAKSRVARETRDEAQINDSMKALRERQMELMKGDKPIGNPMALLTDDQRQKLREIQEKARTQRSAAAGGEGDRGRVSTNLIARILERAEDLNLSAEQKTQLGAIKDARDKMESDVAIRTLFTQLRDAAAIFDDSKVGGIVEKINARKTELGIAKDIKSPMDVLTDEQRQKLSTAMGRREAGNGERKPEVRREGGDAARKPDARREGGDAARKPEAKREGGDEPRKPDARREGGDAKRMEEPKREGEKRDSDKKDPAPDAAPTIKIKPNNDL